MTPGKGLWSVEIENLALKKSQHLQTFENPPI